MEEEKKKSTLKRIENFPLFQSMITWSKRISFPGFKEVPLYNVFVFIYRECIKDDLITRANSIAFSLFLALFPSLIFLFTIVPLIPATQDLIPIIDQSLESLLPETAHKYLFSIINDVMSIPRTGLLSLGFFLAIYFGSGGLKTLMRGFDKAYDRTFKPRSWGKFQLVAIGLTVLLVLMLVISIVLIVLGKPVFDALFGFLNIESAATMVKVFRWFFVALVFYFMISILYKYGPSMYKRTSIFNPGAYLSTLLMILVSVLFSYFVNNFGKYNELYGSIGALIALLVWLQINAVILLIGFELNTSIAVNKDLSLDEELQN